MDKKHLKPFKVTVTFNSSFADYCDEAIEQLKGEGFLDARNPHKASVLPLWEDWNLARKEDGTWLFTATVFGISEDDAKIATNVAYTDVNCAALRHLVRTEVEAISEPVNNAVNTVKHAFFYAFDKETASHFFPTEEYGRNLQNWLLNSDFLTEYGFRTSRSCCKDQGDCHVSVSETFVELYVIPRREDIWGKVPLAQAHQFLASTIDYDNEVMLRNSLVRVEAIELVQPALPKVTESKNVNDGEFVRVILDGESATYSYKFETERQFVLDHESELGLSENAVRWWRNRGISDAHVSDWQERENELVRVVKESKAFADLIK